MPSLKNPESSSPVPEILRNREGVPYLFVAPPVDLAAAMDRIPDAVFLEAYAWCWRGHEEPPLRTAAEIRQRALEEHMNRPLLRDATALNREGRRLALRRPTRWHLVPSDLQPDPRLEA